MAPFHRLGLATTLVLLLLVVPFLHRPTMVAGEANPAAAYRIFIVLVSPPADAAAMSRGEFRQWHESFLPSLLTESGEERLVCSYSAVFHGFAARLTEAELAAVAKLPGFVRAIPDSKRYRLTTRTPTFLGLSRDAHELWSDVGYGAGVVIGVVDSGIFGKHVSFLDDGVPEPPARWKGICMGTNATQCNRKLVGSKSFVIGDTDPHDDEQGHGTHVAAIAAGNFVQGASLPGGLGSGTAAGIAPLAHIAAYKVCPRGDDGCSDSSISCGMDEAVKDGVDVINISLGGRPNVTFDMDPIAIGAFGAMAKGVLVVTTAGNEGPDPYTVTNDAPWLLTVGAGSVDRRFDAEVEYSSTTVAGEALYQDTADSGLVRPLEDGGDCHDVRGYDVAGKLVVCSAVNVSAVLDLERAGAAGAVLIGPEIDGYTVLLEGDLGADGFNVIQMDTFQGRDFADYAKTLNASATVSFNGVVLGVRAPAVASFSCRGPSIVTPGLLKPDVLAPGLNIIAASASTTGLLEDWSTRFKVMSGTSMAAPHIAGVAALLKSAHPDWSPAAIKSAIMTTADPTDNSGAPILDEQRDEATSFHMGAGHVNVSRAADPGLVYDVGAAEYAAFVCGLLGEDALKTITADPTSNCSETGTIPQLLLNQPTIMVPLSNSPVTVPRTVTNVGPPETYSATVQGPSSMEITVSPDTLVFSETGEKQSFNVTVMVDEDDGGGDGDFVEGSLVWVSTTHQARSPIVALVGLPEP